MLFWRTFDQGTLATRRGNPKAITSDREGNHLCNLASDLTETNNLLNDNTQQYQQHMQEIKAWKSELIDAIFKPLQGRHVVSKKRKKNQKSKG